MAEATAKIVVDGEDLDADDLTFREQREFRNLIRELLDDPDANVDPDVLPFVDTVPALIVVFKRRKEPEFSLEQALEYKLKDVLQDVTARPTKRAPKPR